MGKWPEEEVENNWDFQSSNNQIATSIPHSKKDL